ncbi:MAG TPA: hypothetical protein VFR33_14085 [Candidatus Dormibacteraeota bacterium]|nr:hypothetical protein [Candidatus Dormibacteraeota bacterium]
MLRKFDRIAIVAVSALVGLQAIIPGWQIMTDGSVYGFKLPAGWLTGAWPFSGYFVAGVLLLVVVGGGCLVTAGIAAFNERAGWIAGLLMGFVLVGWIVGELIFMTETMVMTWIILGAGLLLIGLSAPFALPELKTLISQRAHTKALAS